jgi:hypothetical protein
VSGNWALSRMEIHGRICIAPPVTVVIGDGTADFALADGSTMTTQWRVDAASEDYLRMQFTEGGTPPDARRMVWRILHSGWSYGSEREPGDALRFVIDIELDTGDEVRVALRGHATALRLGGRAQGSAETKPQNLSKHLEDPDRVVTTDKAADREARRGTKVLSHVLANLKCPRAIAARLLSDSNPLRQRSARGVTIGSAHELGKEGVFRQGIHVCHCVSEPKDPVLCPWPVPQRDPSCWRHIALYGAYPGGEFLRSQDSGPLHDSLAPSAAAIRILRILAKPRIARSQDRFVHASRTRLVEVNRDGQELAAALFRPLELISARTASGDLHHVRIKRPLGVPGPREDVLDLRLLGPLAAVGAVCRLLQ